MNEQLLKTSGADVLSSRKKLKKPYGGGGMAPPPPCPPVRQRVKYPKDLEDILHHKRFCLVDESVNGERIRTNNFLVPQTGFVRVLEILKSPGKILLVLESPGNLLN